MPQENLESVSLLTVYSQELGNQSRDSIKEILHLITGGERNQAKWLFKQFLLLVETSSGVFSSQEWNQKTPLHTS